MVDIRQKTLVTQKLHGNVHSHSKTVVTTRDVSTIVDEPKERGGTNEGPSPTETVTAALIACTNVIGHKCADRHGVTFRSMSIDAETTMDRRGTQLIEEIEVPFPKIRLTVNVTTDASDEDIEKVKADLNRFCPVAKVLRNAGTEIEEVWIVSR